MDMLLVDSPCHSHVAPHGTCHSGQLPVKCICFVIREDRVREGNQVSGKPSQLYEYMFEACSLIAINSANTNQLP